MNIQRIAERFGKLQLKERRLVLIAGVAGVLLLGYGLVIDPALQGAETKGRILAQQQNELDTLQSQLVGLRAQAANPDAALRADVESTLKQIAGVEGDLRQFDALLVPPAQMPNMLQSLLSKHKGLALVRVKTLPATPLLAPAAKDAPTAQAQPAQGVSDPAGGSIYRHAIEITVAGSYAELTAYADELQRISPRPLWSAMALKVVEYPRSELTFTIYTLSLDLPWLAV